MAKSESAADAATKDAATDTGAVDTSNVHLSNVPGLADTVDLTPDELAPATEPEASGALQEPTIAERVDTQHPAVDDEPRKGLPVSSNQIDFNDPTITGAEAVKRNLEVATPA